MLKIVILMYRIYPQEAEGPQPVVSQYRMKIRTVTSFPGHLYNAYRDRRGSHMKMHAMDVMNCGVVTVVCTHAC